jgi:adenosine deaminase
MRIDTIWDIAHEQDIVLPASSKEELRQILEVGENCDSLATYLKPFDITVSVLQTEANLQRALLELAEDCAAENIRYLEVRFAPALHTRNGLKLTQVLDAVLSGIKIAESTWQITIRVIICGLRHTAPAETLKVAELAVAYKNKGVVGFDLAGAEKDFPAKDHIEAFYLIVNNNINTTAHAGEASGPESIHEALHYINANRIGHGTRLRENGDLLNYVNDHRIPLEMCITSNLQTKAVSSYERHPIKSYLDYGIRVTLNTDNRLISKTTLTDEYMKAIEIYHFDLDEVRMVILNGFKSAFLPFGEKARLIKQINTEMRDLGIQASTAYE